MSAVTKQEILDLIRSRELTTRSREVYKEENKKIEKDPSRIDREDEYVGKISTRSAFEPEAVASNSLAFVSDKSSLESETSSPGSQGREEGNVISPRELTSRYSGISVQHVKTSKGVKIAITLQTPEWAKDGSCQMATAELKRYDRMREVKARADDSEYFTNYLNATKLMLQEAGNKNVCLGRLHERGKRSAWIYDTLVVGFFEQDRMTRVMLYLEGEEHAIELDRELSPNQQQYYHALGIQGQIASAKKIPKLADLPLVKFGE